MYVLHFNNNDKQAIITPELVISLKAWVASFDKPKMVPQSLMACPTGLSPYLRFGCLSPRLFYWRLFELHSKVNTF